MQFNYFGGNKYIFLTFQVKLSRFQQPREQLEKQLKEMSIRNELLEAELGKNTHTHTHEKLETLYCQILERGKLWASKLDSFFSQISRIE